MNDMSEINRGQLLEVILPCESKGRLPVAAAIGAARRRQRQRRVGLVSIVAGLSFVRTGPVATKRLPPSAGKVSLPKEMSLLPSIVVETVPMGAGVRVRTSVGTIQRVRTENLPAGDRALPSVSDERLLALAGSGGGRRGAAIIYAPGGTRFLAVNREEPAQGP